MSRRGRPGDDPGAEDERLSGRHAVEEALKAGVALNRILVAEHLPVRVTERIRQLAHERQVPVAVVPRARLEAVMGGEAHQGMVALVAAAPLLTEADLDGMLDRAANPFLLLLDGIQDPHNLGAILRVADATGATAVVVPRHGAPGVTAAVARAAAGATAWVSVVRVTNMVQTMERLKARGVFVWAADPEAAQPYTALDARGPTALVVGAEGRGIRPLVKAHTDGVVAIPMAGHVGSLNAATAAAVLAFEVARQRRKK